MLSIGSYTEVIFADHYIILIKTNFVKMLSTILGRTPLARSDFAHQFADGIIK